MRIEKGIKGKVVVLEGFFFSMGVGGGSMSNASARGNHTCSK